MPTTSTLGSLVSKALACGLLAIAGASQAAPVLTFNGSDYYLATVGGWAAGEAEAVALGGHLVTLNDAAEEAALRASPFGGTLLYWIGYNDAAVEGSFVWSSGEAVTYEHWNGGEPNNQGNEDYTLLNWNTGNGAWNDLADSTSIFGIIEVRRVTTVPEPGMLALAGLALLGLRAGSRRKA